MLQYPVVTHSSDSKAHLHPRVVIKANPCDTTGDEGSIPLMEDAGSHTAQGWGSSPVSPLLASMEHCLQQGGGAAKLHPLRGAAALCIYGHIVSCSVRALLEYNGALVSDSRGNALLQLHVRGSH